MKTLEKTIRLEPVLPRSEATQSRYVINENAILGEGGMGVVYRGLDTELDREVAIKRLRPKESGCDATFPDALKHEAQLLASLNHPNIVTVYDVYQDKGEVFIVMELLEGNTLESITQNTRLEMEAFSELVLQTQDALCSANEAGILHGDLKPQNIIQTRLGSGRKQYKLLDFDQARLIGREMRLTGQQSTCGSIYFMAPERFEGTAPTQASDIYAMGCVYYYVLTGTFPCQGNNPVEVMASHLRNDITPLSELRPDLPEWLGQWIEWLLARDPKNRPQSALAVSTSFKELLNQFSMVPEKVIGVSPSDVKNDNAWHVARGNQVGGPHTWETVQAFLDSGALTTDDLIKNTTMPQWVNISTLTECLFKNAG